MLFFFHWDFRQELLMQQKTNRHQKNMRHRWIERKLVRIVIHQPLAFNKKRRKNQRTISFFFLSLCFIFPMTFFLYLYTFIIIVLFINITSLVVFFIKAGGITPAVMYLLLAGTYLFIIIVCSGRLACRYFKSCYCCRRN